MLPQGSPFLRSAVWTAALVLSLGTIGEASAQSPAAPTERGSAPANLGEYRMPGPLVPESLEPRIERPAARGGTGTTEPVLAPGYFEVVCPAMCYGAAFHVCGRKAFGGPGYYGPLRRLWGYSTYGPNFNIGPDNSIQYGQIGGVIYVAERRCKGLYKHGTDPGIDAGAVPPLSARAGGVPSPPVDSGPTQPAEGPAQRPVEKLSQPTPNAARLQLLVPENAEVLVEGIKTTTTGTVREFVSPPLEPGKNMIYAVLVRYTDAGGKVIEETHTVRVHANDQLNIDCTKPAAAEQPRATAQRP
ncbi:MAG TPA: TIGR03000 domain-containing protein [Gemmataceae bacterium]|nr:TIGR03000 domain-containing protein [Gemmataceae bacterium]